MGTDLGFEEKLWLAADKLRSNMDAAEYKHVVLGLIFLKYISDSFEELYNRLKAEPEGLPEDKDEYLEKRVFWVPKEARWNYIQDNAKNPIIGKIIDEAMDSIEKENPSLKGILLKEYAKPSLDKAKLGGLIDLIGSITFGSKESKSKDVLGRVYEYFLGQFASAEGKKGGQFYTPKCIVRLLVEMIKPYKGRVFDPCCGSGGMFVQSENFVNEHGGKIGQISIYGQESNQTTWKLCKMNLAIRGIDNKVVWNTEGSFLNDEHKDLRSDFILANPPFNDSDWSGELLRDDVRWKYGVPPTGNANFAWVQHFIYHLSPTGIAGFVLSNGSLSSNTSNEGEIRKAIIKEDIVDCVVALPSQLFYNTMIPACLWFVNKINKNKPSSRKGEILFIDARNLGRLINRRQRTLTEEDIKKISDTYDLWKTKDSNYKDELAFCKSAKLEEIEKQGFILTPGRYVGFKEEEEDLEAFQEKMLRLTKELSQQMEEGKKLDEEIKKNLKGIGFEVK